MERRARTIKTLCLIPALLFSVAYVNAQTRYAVADGNWNATSTWSTTSGGSPGASVPSSTSAVYIMNNIDVTVTAGASCASITFPGPNASLSVNTSVALTVTGNITLNNLASASTSCLISGEGSISCNDINAGSGTDPTVNNTTYLHTFRSSVNELIISGSVYINSYIGNRTSRRGNGVFNHEDGLVSVTGSISTSNENNVNTSVFSMAAGSAAGTLLLYGSVPFDLSWTGTSTLTVNGSSATVIYARNGAQNIQGLTYNNLTVVGGDIKTIQDDITVNGVLNLEAANISLGSGSFNLTVGPGGTITTAGIYDNAHMIVCNGSGNLVKQGTAVNEFIMIYPVGTGTLYTPFEITQMTASLSGTGSLSVRAVPTIAPGPPSASGTDLVKYWNIITSNISNINADVKMTYINPDEVGTGGDQANYIPYLYTAGVWTQPATYSPSGTNPMTASGVSILEGQWTAREEPAITTYYSYKSGAWNSADTWTTDPSGSLFVNPGVPDETDRVVILNGRTVTTTANGENLLSVQINEGGILDLGSFTTQNFTIIRGKGLVKLSTALFPSGDWTNFVATGGGTVEYYNSSSYTFSQLTYNNLIINLSSEAVVATLTGNMVVNGDLTVTRGMLRINDGSSISRSLSVDGDVYVNNTASIGIGTGNANHRFRINGDFINDGIVRLTNQATPSYTTIPSNGRADLVFDNPAADQNLLCNSQSDFYRIEIDKGIDKTFVLNIDADESSDFTLFGRSNLQTSPPASNPPDIENPNALGLLAGTVRLGPNIILPSLSGNTVYNIDLDARLWLDGANVTFSTVASTSSIVVYGSLRISNMATLNANGDQGIVMRDQSELLIESGQVTTDCIRTSYISGTHRGAFIMTGGTLNILGNSLNITGLNIYASFTLPYPDNVFRMSGGTINIESPTTITGGPGSNFSIIIGSNLNNSSVSGGTINITIPGNRNAYINTTVPLWNLNFTSSSSTYWGQVQTYTGNSSPPIPAITANTLHIYNELNILNNAVFNANGNDVTIGRNLTVGSAAEYETGNNTTIFNGTTGQRFTNAGTVNNGTGLYNLTVSDSSNTDIYSNNLVIRGSLTLGNGGIINDIGHILSVAGNIYNSGTHISQAGGAVILNGTVDQSIGGSGQGVFGNLSINKSSGASILEANQTVNGNLRLANGILDIGTLNLSLGPQSNIYDALSGTTTSFSGTKMIRLAGNKSDRGVTKFFNATTQFLYPVGTGTDYTPASIQFSAAPVLWGSVTVRPVKQPHPFITSPPALNYYWGVSSSGFEGVQPGSVSHTYQYVTSDIIGTEANYIPAAYRPYSWVPVNDNSRVVDASNTIVFSLLDYIDGDYTAGEPAAFQSVKVFYSRQNGNWDDPLTWSSVVVGGAIDGALPGSYNPVVIGDSNLHHIVTVPAGLNNISVGGLQISDSSILDLQTTTGHNFGMIPDARISGSGTIRISSSAATAVFPGGDFGAFLAQGGGTVEYYSSGTTGTTTFTLPATYLSGGSTTEIQGYNNLVLAPASGKNIIFPDTDLSVTGVLTVSGDGISQFNVLPSLRSIYAYSDLIIHSGTLRFMNGSNTAQNLIIYGNVIIDSGATFDVNTAGSAANSMTLYGNLTNNGIFDMLAGASQVCNVTFAGDQNKEVTGTGVVTSFNTIEINKGNSRNTILEVKSDVLTLNTSLSTGLTLTNGTFRLTSPITLDLTNSGSFTIPVSGALSANGGTINIGGPGATDATDLKLDGRLEVLNGSVNIGTPGTDLNNDIEYSSGGTPEIIVSGGSLYVNGQIRRVTTINTGSLSYTQSNPSGIVTVAGKNAVSERGIFEIMNSGSKFNMSGGTLNITGSFNDPGLLDFYLAPDSGTVTGGTILFGSSETPAATTFTMVTSLPLFAVEVDATTSAKTLDLKIYPLTLKNNLTINGNSVFRANGLDVTIGGNLTNQNGSSGAGLNTGGYQPGEAGQMTIFNGNNNNSITGNGANLTNFSNVTVITADTLTLAATTAVRINGSLTVTEGVLDDGGNNIYLIGNISNEAVHTSSLPGGGIYFAGSQPQTISAYGEGVFGNLTLDNTTGVNITDNCIVTGTLTFVRGALYIDDYLLTLGIDASIAGTTDETKMIILNGVISDAGVRKVFPSGPSAFTFPVGVAGKYTPVSYNFTSNPNNGAYITLEPVNYPHPVMALPEGDELNYYWNITCSGFNEPFAADHQYSYNLADVTGNEAGYYAGRFSENTWIPEGGIPGSSVDPVNHQINLTSVNFIEGEYTAGYSTNFSNTYSLYSIKSGNWFGDNTWSLTDGGASCNCDPAGNPVIINSSHTVILNNNSALAYSVTINGTLDAGLTTFHSLGHVKGGGILKLTSTAEGLFVFPGGDFNDFVNTSGSTVNFFGNNEATLPAKPGNIYKPYQNVIFSGNGKKNISAEELKLLGNLTIQDAGTVLSNSMYGKRVFIAGNWTDNNTSSSGGYIPGKSLVVFDGSANQLLTINGGAVTDVFYNLEIDNPSGMTISGTGQVIVSGNLILTNGVLFTNDINLLYISNNNKAAVDGGDAQSFVSGPLKKRILSGGEFTFPTGDGTGLRYGPLTLTDVSSTGDYTARYLNHNPLAEGYDPEIRTAPIDVVSNTEYWNTEGPLSSTANVILRWDEESGIIPADAATRNKLRVVEWQASWINRGNRNITGDQQAGTIETDPEADLAGLHIFTIGAESLPTATITSGDASICDDGSSVNIIIGLTGTAPWEIKYLINGTAETTITNIATSPYSLVVSNAHPVLDAGGPGTYSFSLSSVKDGTGSTGIRDFVTSAIITLNETPSPVISGLATTPAGSLVTYTSPYADGVTFLWSVTGGTIQNGQGTNEVEILWGAGPTGNITLTETVVAGGCTSTTSPFIVSITDVPDPRVTGSNSVCFNASEIYSTPLVSGHTYSWNITGGTFTMGATDNIITVIWNTVGEGEVSVTETGSIPVTNFLPVTVNPVPPENNSVSDPVACINTPANIIIAGTLPGITYQLRLNADNTPVGSPVSSMGGGDVTITVFADETTTYNILASNEYNCYVILSDLAEVTVTNSQTWTGLINTDWNNPGNWSCGSVPDLVHDITIPDVTNKPVISSGASAKTNNLVIAAGSSLTLTGNTIQIAGTIANNGTFDALSGTLEFCGSSAQSVPSGTFSSNNVGNLVINNSAGVTLLGELSVIGVVRLSSGNLASDGFLTLVSSATQTALIDGQSTGVVTGIVTMQRYLPAGFGYKYFSSPFQSATVAGFGDDLNLASSFPSFYRYDEARTSSGWVSYTNPAGILNPFQGYAANFGSSAAARTVDLTGVVNNGSLSVTLYNHDNTYTKGFNLAGNPYPSPIDWDSEEGWTRTNIDDAIYFFKASTTDQYGGTYHSYVNGISSDGLASSIIPSMQGFFVHVSDGIPTVEGSISLNNDVRINNQSQSFLKSESKGPVPLIRLDASFTDDTGSSDPVVIYLDEKASEQYDTNLDALKLFNTDQKVLNLFSLGTDEKKLSINALPFSYEKDIRVPLGLKTYKNGYVRFRISSAEGKISQTGVWLSDAVGGTELDLLPDREYQVFLNAGEHYGRFFLNLRNIATEVETTPYEQGYFRVYSSNGIIKAEIETIIGNRGTLEVFNLTGQLIFKTEIFETGYYELDPDAREGICIVTYTTGSARVSRKIYITNR